MLYMSVTIVVSSMYAQHLPVCQVTALIQADIPASFISSQQTKTEVTAVLSELRKAQPTCKLLYVTPEQLVKSSSLQSILSALHNRGLLARLVIDEVACMPYQPYHKVMAVQNCVYIFTCLECTYALQGLLSEMN